jgi:antitoxin component YwqK of YwqJK toxin-antitoxin module
MKYIFLAASLLTLAISSCTEPKEANTAATQAQEQQDRMYIESYDNGQPKIKGLLRNGEREGLWVAFYENGVRWSEDNYINGSKEGRSITFFPSGIIRYRGQYMNNEKIGLWQFYDETGKVAEELEY